MDSSVYMLGRDVLFVHWPVSPDRLRPHIPTQLELDLFDGSAWVSALALEVARAHPTAIPLSLTGSFPQLNFRTYVEFGGESGVYFISLDTGDQLGRILGQRAYRLPFQRAQMDFRRRGRDIVFRSRRTEPDAPEARFDVRYRPEGESFSAQPGSIEEFLIERHRYYVPADEPAMDDSDNGTEQMTLTNSDSETSMYIGEITRESWELRSASANIRTNSLFSALGMDTPKENPLLYYSPEFETTTGRPELSH